MTDKLIEIANAAQNKRKPNKSELWELTKSVINDDPLTLADKVKLYQQFAPADPLLFIFPGECLAVVMPYRRKVKGGS